jgi:hypothetical protein
MSQKIQTVANATAISSGKTLTVKAVLDSSASPLARIVLVFNGTYFGDELSDGLCIHFAYHIIR